MNLTLPGEVIAEAVLDAGKTLLDRFFPDPAKRAEAELALYKYNEDNKQKWYDRLQASDTNQTEVNKVEAASDSLFKSGWRPALGWIVVSSFCIKFIVFPLLAGFLPIFGVVFTAPFFDVTEIMTLVFGMLGLGALRTYEKVKGAA